METEERLHLTDFTIAGFAYYDGTLAFSDLHIGSQLQLVREYDNKFDPCAVALYFGKFKIGFVPKEENETLSKLLDQGWGQLFDVRVNRLSPDMHPSKQVGAVIFIKRNPSGTQAFQKGE